MCLIKGDKVRLVRDVVNIDRTIAEGTEGVVLSDGGVGYVVKFDGDTARYGRWVDAWELELIEEATG